MVSFPKILEKTMKPFSSRLHAQGATEYLVILAVVLVIGLLVVGLLGGFSGTAADTQNTQNEMYWQTRTPIAIMGGKADNLTWSDSAYIILKNNGKYPLELLAIGPIGSPHNGLVMHVTGESDIPLSYELQFLSTEGYGDPTYLVYIAPPRGNGSAGYSQRNILNPGEQIMVGFSVYPGAASNAGYNVNQVCVNSNGNHGTAIEFSKLIIYYRENVNGVKVVKKQEMSDKPLDLPCN